MNLKGTHQKDDIVLAPMLPVKTSKIFIPADEKVVSAEIRYGTLNEIKGSYTLQQVTTAQPRFKNGYVTVEQPAEDYPLSTS